MNPLKKLLGSIDRQSGRAIQAVQQPFNEAVRYLDGSNQTHPSKSGYSMQNPIPQRQPSARGYRAPGTRFEDGSGFDMNGNPYAPQPQLRVQQGNGIQPPPRMAEDDYTPTDALERTGYFNPQASLNGSFVQESMQPQQRSYSPQYGGIHDALRLLLRR